MEPDSPERKLLTPWKPSTSHVKYRYVFRNIEKGMQSVIDDIKEDAQRFPEIASPLLENVE